MIKKSGQLKARFVKAILPNGFVNLNKGHWEVFVGKDLIFTLYLEDLIKRNKKWSYDNVATRIFGVNLITRSKKLSLFW